MRIIHLSTMLACMSMFCSGMDVKEENPFSFFKSEIERLHALHLKNDELKEYSIPMLLEKRRSVAQMYLASLYRLLLIPADRFPDPHNISATSPHAQNEKKRDGIVCSKRMSNHDAKIVAIGLVTRSFSRLIKTIDEHGGAELAARVGQEGDDENLMLMLKAVRAGLAAQSAEEIPENEPSSSYASEQTDAWQNAASLSSSDAEEEEDEDNSGNLKRMIRVHGDLEKSEFRSDAEVGDSDLIAFISLSGLDSWGE